ncbi:unnamed protein product [Haemonchus placei]|uniref:VPS9 domain-containing protein n=1 Tax=Haemonchus placei TaxID=6290 RepID=A0A3P7Z5T5_HAEPC|nr:unnamed protein product [Haemonchus placei]
MCPAIINPEHVGIVSDTPISHIARFNLMQIGQIIQVSGLLLRTKLPTDSDGSVFGWEFVIGMKLENEREQLVMLLRTLLAEAVNNREQSLVAHTREVMRCLQIFDNKGFVLWSYISVNCPSNIASKTDCLLRTLTGMYARLPVSSMWQSAPAHLVAYARKTIERVFMAQIHALAFYPNLDADRHRDELVYHSLLLFIYFIVHVLHGEAPWPSAQAEISIINAYKSARDKLACVVRCCETISNLISMAPGMGAAAADDVTPVLVYVLIQANPPSLLSNVQYVQGFGGSLLDGAEGYWWTQFTAAIEFVKTLL